MLLLEHHPAELEFPGLHYLKTAKGVDVEPRSLRGPDPPRAVRRPSRFPQ